MHPEVTAYLAEIGSKGGKTVTDRKRQALKVNASKPRPNRRKKMSVLDTSNRISTD